MAKSPRRVQDMTMDEMMEGYGKLNTMTYKRAQSAPTWKPPSGREFAPGMNPTMAPKKGLEIAPARVPRSEQRPEKASFRYWKGKS